MAQEKCSVFSGYQGIQDPIYKDEALVCQGKVLCDDYNTSHEQPGPLKDNSHEDFSSRDFCDCGVHSDNPGTTNDDLSHDFISPVRLPDECLNSKVIKYITNGILGFVDHDSPPNQPEEFDEVEGKNLATSDIGQQDPFNTDFQLAQPDLGVDPPEFIDCNYY